LFNVGFDDFLIYCSDSSTEISDCPERFLFSPVELFQVRFELLLSEHMEGTSSFEKLYHIGNGVNEWNTEIYVYMIFFHAYCYWCNVEFFADSFEYFLYFILKRFYETFSSILCYPYNVIPAVIYCMGGFSVSHVAL
jgi:hypothetical protein